MDNNQDTAAVGLVWIMRKLCSGKLEGKTLTIEQQADE